MVSTCCYVRFFNFACRPPCLRHSTGSGVVKYSIASNRPTRRWLLDGLSVFALLAENYELQVYEGLSHPGHHQQMFISASGPFTTVPRNQRACGSISSSGRPSAAVSGRLVFTLRVSLHIQIKMAACYHRVNFDMGANDELISAGRDLVEASRVDDGESHARGSQILLSVPPDHGGISKRQPDGRGCP